MRGRQAHSLKISETPATQRLRDSAPRIHPLHGHRHASTHHLRLPGAIGGTGTGWGHGPGRRPRSAGTGRAGQTALTQMSSTADFCASLQHSVTRAALNEECALLRKFRVSPDMAAMSKNAALGARQLQPGGQRQQPGAAGVNRVPIEALQCKLYLASRSPTPAFARYSSHQIPVQLSLARAS